MSEPRRCPQCGAVLSAEAPAGLCPECLLRQGLESDAPCPAATVLKAEFLPPRLEELAPLFPHLQILELLGKGGMGAVYQARQLSLDRFVALKILPPEVGRDPAFAERFAREARALARLSHQNIVAVYDFGQTLPPAVAAGSATDQPPEGLYYFVMEYVDGASLRQLIQRGSLAPAEALAIIPQICEALQFAHEEGIVHRDVKPENILLDKRGRVKIADFGLAKLLRMQPVDVTLTQANQVMGTWHYMAPEQLEHPQAVDHRADIYSLGVVFYEMLTGQLPLGRFEPPSKKAPVDVRLDQVVLRALEREPEQRYQYASEVKTDVEAIGRSSAAGRCAVAATSEAAARGTQCPDLSAAPLGATASELFGGWLFYVLCLFCAAVIATGVGAAWQFGFLGRWGGPTLEVDPQFAWLRWPLAGLGVLMAILGVVGLVQLVRWFGPGRAAQNSAETATSTRRRMSKAEREALFGELIGVAVMLGLLGLVWFGMWITASSWFLVALGLPWIVPGIAAALDERDETTPLVPWALAIAVVGTLCLLGYGLWLAKSGWPLLAIAMPFVGLVVSYHFFGDDEKKASAGSDSSDTTADGSAAASPSNSAESEESDDAGWGCLIVPIVVFVVIPVLKFIASSVSDVNEFLLDEFDLDPRLRRPMLAAIWAVLFGGLAYGCYQMYELLKGLDESQAAGHSEGGDSQAVLSRAEVRRNRLARLSASLAPFVLILVLVLGSSDLSDRATAPAPADAPAAPQIGQLLQAAENGDAARVRQLLVSGADVNSIDPETGETPLMKAAARGHTALAVTLLLLGADVNAQNKKGESALMLAAENGRTAAIRAWYDLRRLTWETDVEKRKAALRAFPGFDRVLIADRDLDLADLNIEEHLRDQQGETASMKALRAVDPACFALFTNDMDNQLARDQRGRNVAMHAAMAGRTDLFRRLEREPYYGSAGVSNLFVGPMVMFDFELSLSQLDNDGQSILQLAEEHGQRDIAKILRAHFEAIVAHQTREIEKGGDKVAPHYRLRGLAHQVLGNQEQAEADLTASGELGVR